MTAWDDFRHENKGKWDRDELSRRYQEWKRENQKERGSRSASAPRPLRAPSPRTRSPSPWDEHRRACKGMGLSPPQMSQLYWEKRNQPDNTAHDRGSARSSAVPARGSASSPASTNRPRRNESQPQPQPPPASTTPPRKCSPPARQRPAPVPVTSSILDNVSLGAGWIQPTLARDYARPHPALDLGSAMSAAVGQRLVATTLPAGVYKHHVGSSLVPIPGGAKAALFRAYGDRRVFMCAQRGCYTTVYAADGKGVGAHIMVSKDMELMKLAGRGGTAVVPLCNECHNCRGAAVELKETKALLDRQTPVDLRLQAGTGAGPQRGLRPRSTGRSRAV